MQREKDGRRWLNNLRREYNRQLRGGGSGTEIEKAVDKALKDINKLNASVKKVNESAKKVTSSSGDLADLVLADALSDDEDDRRL